jgi:hypothetical protein
MGEAQGAERAARLVRERAAISEGERADEPCPGDWLTVPASPLESNANPLRGVAAEPREPHREGRSERVRPDPLDDPIGLHEAGPRGEPAARDRVRAIGRARVARRTQRRDVEADPYLRPRPEEPIASGRARRQREYDTLGDPLFARAAPHVDELDLLAEGGRTARGHARIDQPDPLRIEPRGPLRVGSRTRELPRERMMPEQERERAEPEQEAPAFARVASELAPARRASAGDAPRPDDERDEGEPPERRRGAPASIGPDDSSRVGEQKQQRQTCRPHDVPLRRTPPVPGRPLAPSGPALGSTGTPLRCAGEDAARACGARAGSSGSRHRNPRFRVDPARGDVARSSEAQASGLGMRARGAGSGARLGEKR